MTIDFHRENVCLADCATMHTIFKSKLYFSYLAMKKKMCAPYLVLEKWLKASEKLKYCYPKELK
jgi:hypothetical protein